MKREHITLLIFLWIPASAVAKEALEDIRDYAISGTIEFEENDKKIKIEDLSWHIAFKTKLGFKPISVLRGSLTVDEKNCFLIRPNNPSDRLGGLFKTECILVALYRGALAKTEPFQVGSAPVRISGLRLKFGPPGTCELKARITDPETGRVIPNAKVSLRMDGNSFPIEFGELEVARATSDEQGIVRIENLPEGRFEVIASDGTLAEPKGIWALQGCWLSSHSAERAKEELPTVHWIPFHTGMYWHRMPTDASKPVVKEGTLLEFKAFEKGISTPEDKWNGRLKFRVKVGEHGLVKTPVVPAGRYKVASIDGDPYEEDLSLWMFVSWNRDVFERVSPPGSDNEEENGSMRQ